MEANTNRVTLHFKREEILYDCRNLAYIEGDVAKTDDEHARHQIMDIGEDGNVDWVTRVLGLGIAKCRELLFPYSKLPVEKAVAMDDELEEPNAYVIELNVPGDFSQTTVTLLEHLIHMLLVYMVMEHWMRLTNLDNTKSADNWRVRIDETEEEISDAKNGLCNVRHITPRPW